MQATAYEQGSGQIVIALSAPGQTGQTSISIPIEVRTNVAYELRAAATAADGCAPVINARIESVGVSGTQAMRDAAQGAAFSGSPARLEAAPAALLNGPRISKAGTFSTPTNALRIKLIVTVSQQPLSACDWHATVRLSLRPAAAE